MFSVAIDLRQAIPRRSAP